MAFIPLAEETGLIVPVGEWVLETACRQAASWAAGRHRPDAAPLFVSVNLSARQFTQADLVEDVAAILAETGSTRRARAGDHRERADGPVRGRHPDAQRAARLGVRLVLDDFGTGYSSLAYLKHLPLDTIKIDRSFVAGIDETADRSIVEAVVALAHGLEIGVVAEGIETDAQADRLRELGCDLGQGYLFSRPVDADRTMAVPAVDRAARALRSKTVRAPSCGRRQPGRSVAPPPNKRSMNRNRLMKSR